MKPFLHRVRLGLTLGRTSRLWKVLLTRRLIARFILWRPHNRLGMSASDGPHAGTLQHEQLCSRFLPTLDGHSYPNITHLKHPVNTICPYHVNEVRFDLVFKYRSAALIQSIFGPSGKPNDVLEIGAGYGA